MEIFKGNIFDTKAQVIAHGVNCQGVFNAGLAKQIRLKYPAAFNAYRIKHVKENWLLGQIQVVQVEQARYIANMATQIEYGTDKQQVNYYAVKTCLEKLFEFCSKKELTSVAIPKIGCGLGGGDWKEVHTILVDLSKEWETIDLQVWEL